MLLTGGGQPSKVSMKSPGAKGREEEEEEKEKKKITIRSINFTHPLDEIKEAVIRQAACIYDNNAELLKALLYFP